MPTGSFLAVINMIFLGAVRPRVLIARAYPAPDPVVLTGATRPRALRLLNGACPAPVLCCRGSPPRTRVTFVRTKVTKKRQPPSGWTPAFAQRTRRNFDTRFPRNLCQAAGPT